MQGNKPIKNPLPNYYESSKFEFINLINFKIDSKHEPVKPFII